MLTATLEQTQAAQGEVYKLSNGVTFPNMISQYKYTPKMKILQ